jgi:hypothetical protein
VAFYDDAARTPGRPALGRAYLLTTEQLLDVAAQELGLAPGSLTALPSLGAGFAHVIDAGRYGTLVGCEPIGDVPAATLTAPWRLGDEPPAAPSLAYLRTIAEGLAESHGLDAHAQAQYLSALPGAAGAWDAGELAAALSA